LDLKKAARYSLIPLPLSPENLLVVKEIDGNQICAEDLMGFFQCYIIDILNRNDVPKPKSIHEDFFIIIFIILFVNISHNLSFSCSLS